LIRFLLAASEVVKQVHNFLSSEENRHSDSFLVEIASKVFSNVDDPEVIVKFVNLAHDQQDLFDLIIFCIGQALMFSLHDRTFNSLDIFPEVKNNSSVEYPHIEIDHLQSLKDKTHKVRIVIPPNLFEGFMEFSELMEKVQSCPALFSAKFSSGAVNVVIVSLYPLDDS
jgi:hypothetical protein